MRCRFLIPLVVLLIVPLLAHAQPVRTDMIVSTEWLASRLDSVIAVDVANAASFAEGHVPGARLLDVEELVVENDGLPNELPDVDKLKVLFTNLGVGDRDRIVLYSRDPLLAARAWFTLDYLGQGHRASVLDGGLAKWKAEGRAVVRETSPVTPLDFTATPQPTAITEKKALRELVRWRDSLGEAYVLIDARPAPFYEGATPGADIRRAGHIPGALSIPWMQNIAADGTFLPASELRKLYAGVKPRGTTAVVYCRTGMEASMTYFILRYLGCDASLYDGSFIEWSGSNDTPVA